MIEKMAQLVNDKIIQGISDIRDESDRVFATEPERDE